MKFPLPFNPYLPPRALPRDSPSGPKKASQQEITAAAKKETTKVEKINQNKFQHLVKAANLTLLQISNVFPFDLFTDEITIEISQVNVIKREFFATAHLQTIPIKNVADVFLQTSLFFASLKIIDSSYIENSIQVEYLRKAEACKARRIIQGLVIAHKEGIDISKIPLKQIIHNIETLGQAKEMEPFL
ncbi:MAG TPA: hypothetical protein VG935_02575 [Patescibacteria group bacterium]|nr:hypothetical protein [Patescibacteria group bacterium]